MDQSEILLVEDDMNCKELALRALKKAGYGKVAVARDGVEALGMLMGDGGEEPAGNGPLFVLLDMKLPKLDGIGVLQRLRSHDRTRGLSIFSLSSSQDPSEIQQCLNLGVLAVLPKPLDPERLKKWFPDRPALS